MRRRASPRDTGFAAPPTTDGRGLGPGGRLALKPEPAQRRTPPKVNRFRPQGLLPWAPGPNGYSPRRGLPDARERHLSCYGARLALPPRPASATGLRSASAAGLQLRYARQARPHRATQKSYCRGAADPVAPEGAPFTSLRTPSIFHHATPHPPNHGVSRFFFDGRFTARTAEREGPQASLSAAEREGFQASLSAFLTSNVLARYSSGRRAAGPRDPLFIE